MVFLIQLTNYIKKDNSLLVSQSLKKLIKILKINVLYNVSK